MLASALVRPRFFSPDFLLVACFFQRETELAEHIVVGSLCDVNGLFPRLFAKPPAQFIRSSRHRTALPSYRRGSTGRDTYGDVQSLARIWGIDKDVALTAAKREAELKDLTQAEAVKRDPRKPETEDQKLERVCENRRRKWDCFHLATAQLLGCPEVYSTDNTLQKRPSQLGITSLKVISPEVRRRRIPGPITEAAGEIDV